MSNQSRFRLGFLLVSLLLLFTACSDTPSSGGGLTPKEPTNPGSAVAPSDLTLTSGDGKITLTWKNNDSDARILGIFRTEGEKADQVLEFPASPDDTAVYNSIDNITFSEDIITTYDDTTVKLGTKYRYYVGSENSGFDRAWVASEVLTYSDIPAPTDLALTGNTVAENQLAGTVVGTLSAKDERGSALTYSLVAGNGDADNASFTVDGSELKTAAAFDFEAKKSYSVRVQVSDGTLSAAQSFTVTVTNVDEPATDLTLSSSEVEEIQPIGEVVGMLGNNDPEGDTTLTYSLVAGEGSADNATFKIDGNELQTNDFIDYETKNSYSVRVQGTGEGVSLEKNFTINVTNIDDTAPDLNWTDPGTLTVGEPATLSGTVDG